MTEKELTVKERQEVQHPGEPTKPERSFVPAVDIFETDQAVTVFAEMPGVCKECVDIALDDGVLTIKGWLPDQEAKSGEKILLQEYESGSFIRRFMVSESIDQDKIAASMTDGMLTVKLPKVEPAKPRRIEVKAG